MTLIPSGERAPPHDLDAEAAVLSAIILDPVSFDRVMGIVKDVHFYADANRRIFQAVCDLRLGGHAADPVLIANWLRDRGRLGEVGGTPYILQIIDATPAVSNVEAHAIIVREKWRLRQTIAIGQHMAAEGYAPVENVQAFVERFEQELADVAHENIQNREELARPIYKRLIQEMGETRARGEALGGVKTGFTGIDHLMGGLFASDVIVVAARPGMGKTAMALSIACNIARAKPRGDGSLVPGHAVLFCTLEQPREQMVMRLAAHEAEFNAKIWRQTRLTERDWASIVTAFDKVKHLPIWIDDTPALTLGELRAKVRRVKRDAARRKERRGENDIECEELALVVVDYLQLMKGSGDTREQEVAGISKGLKIIAKQERVTVMAISQLNRAVEKRTDKRPTLADLRESGSLEQDADEVGFLYRDAYYDEDTQDRGVAEFILAKQRHGPTGSVDLRFTEQYMRYYNLASEYDEFDDFGESVVP